MSKEQEVFVCFFCCVSPEVLFPSRHTMGIPTSIPLAMIDGDKISPDIWHLIMVKSAFAQPVKPAAKTLLALGTVSSKFYTLSKKVIREYFFDWKDENKSLLLKFPDLRQLKWPGRKALPVCLKEMTNLTELDIATHDLPTEFGSFPCLENLVSLTCGRIHSPLPPLPKLTKLEAMVLPPSLLSCTNLISLTGNCDFNVEQLTKLKNLTCLRGPALMNVKDIDSLLWSLSNIQELSLIFGPNFTGKISDSTITSLPKLRAFHVAGIPISNKSIQSLTDLKELLLYYSNDITEEALENLTNLEILIIDGCPGIKSLELKNNKFPKLDALILGETPHLYESTQNFLNLTSLLCFGSTPETIPNLSKLQKLKKMEVIPRGRVGLPAFEATFIQDLTQIEDLALTGTFISKEKLFKFSNLTNLRIDNNRVQISNEEIKNFRFLKSLSLGNGPVQGLVEISFVDVRKKWKNEFKNMKLTSLGYYPLREKN